MGQGKKVKKSENKRKKNSSKREENHNRGEEKATKWIKAVMRVKGGRGGGRR